MSQHGGRGAGAGGELSALGASCAWRLLSSALASTHTRCQQQLAFKMRQPETSPDIGSCPLGAKLLRGETIGRNKIEEK